MNWATWLVEYEALHKKLHDVAYGGSLYHPPSQPATDADITSAEVALGAKLDNSHAAFLRQANGWLEFSGTLSLLGTRDFVGSKLLERAKKNLGYLSWSALGPYRWKSRRLVPVGVSEASLDVLCMLNEKGMVQRKLVWFNNLEPDEYLSFEAFAEAIRSYTPGIIERFVKRGENNNDA